MSTLKVNNLQVGQDATATNNFTLYQPAVPDGTVRLGVGNSGSVSDLLTVNGTAAKLQINTLTGTTGLKIVGDDTNGYSDIDINSVGTTGYSRLFFSDTAGQSGSIIYAHSANSLQFTTGGSVSATLGGDGLIVGDFTPIDTRNAGGVQVAHSKGISFRSNTSQSVSRNWRIRNDDWGWGNLDFGVGDSVSDISDSAGDTVLSLTSSRNVGIGTTNPEQKLHVAGTIHINGGATGGGVNIKDGAYLHLGTLNSTGSTFIGYGVRAKTVAESAGTNELVSTTSIGLGRSAIVVGSLTGGTSGTFQVWTGPGESGVADGGTLANFQQRLTVDSGGNVGIGTISSNSILHTASEYTTSWPISGGTTDYLPRPHELLIQNTATNTTNSFAGLYFIAGQNSPGSGINSARIGAVRESNNTYECNLVFSTRGPANSHTEKMRIKHNGNVGIGTNNPISKLSVAGGNVEISNGTLRVTGNSSYEEQSSLHSYNTHSATGHRPSWRSFVKFIPTVSSGTYLKIPFVYQGNYYTRTYIRIRGISAQYNSASPKGFLFEGSYGHLTGMNASQTHLVDGNISSVTSHNGTSSSDPPHIRLNFTSAYTGATNQGVDIFIEWFTALPNYSVRPEEIVLN